MIKPYPHQTLAIDEARKLYRNHKRVIMGIPTGGGKTVIAGFIIKSALTKGNTACILCHRIEIVMQFQKLLRKLGIEPSLIVAGQDIEFGHQCYLGMVETFKRRFNPLTLRRLNIKLLVLDEIHWGAYRKVCERFSERILGLTATPKTSAKTPLCDYFDDLLYPVSVDDLISTGLLVPARTFSIEYDFSGLQIKRGEYTEQSLMQEFKRPRLFDGVIQNYLEHANGKKAICYNVNVKHSELITEAFRKVGVRAVHVDADTPMPVRKDIFKLFRHGGIDVLCNVGIATTGYDEPTIECIIENRATTQLTLHHQMIGRGARACSKINKKEFTIIDMGRNYLRHGLYGEPVDWKSIFEKPKEDLEKNETERNKVKTCRGCAAIIKLHVLTCPYCGEKYDKKENEDLFLDRSTLQEIREYKLKQLPAHLRGKKLGAMSREELCEYANCMGYDPKWVHIRWRFRRPR